MISQQALLHLHLVGHFYLFTTVVVLLIVLIVRRRQLREKDDQLKVLFQRANDMIYLYELNENGQPLRFTEVNNYICKRFGYSRAEFLKLSPIQLIPEDSKIAFLQNSQQLMNTDYATYEVVYETKKKNRLICEVNTQAFTLNGKRVALSISRDITERKKMEQVLLETNQRLRSLFDHNPDAVFTVDLNGRFITMNSEVMRLSGFEREEVLGMTFLQVARDEDRSKLLYHFAKAIQGEIQNFETVIIQKNGEPIDLEVRTVPIVVNGKISGLYGIAKAITERKKAEEMITYMAYHDSLTGLPNRRSLLMRLEKELAAAKTEQRSFYLLFLDMDRFKKINDSLGHVFGDLVLKRFAERLQESIGGVNYVARFGGDEFVVLLPDIGEFTEVNNIVDRIVRSFNSPLLVRDFVLYLSPSIGIARYPHHGEDTETLLKNADIAMYHAKTKGKRHQYYLPTETDKPFQEVQLENDLRQAIERNEFYLAYQPQFSMKSGKIIGIEALIRWKHPQNGIIPPNDFIPLAEETGLIVQIGNWVLRRACEQIKDWNQRGYPPLHVSVNLSLGQFLDGHLVEMIRQILQETGIAPEHLQLEITESMTADVTYTIETLHQLKQLGVRISMDDFGTGYSSLSYLKNFPLDQLKIDKSFIKDVLKDEKDVAIVKTIIKLSHNLGLEVIAEGVENFQQLALLKENQCDKIQGYLVSPPISAEQIEEKYLQVP
nr:EAL domain-containing protein [Brevibacillus fulvus]